MKNLYALLFLSLFFWEGLIAKERMKKETHVMYMLIYLILNMALFAFKNTDYTSF